ncbi:MAG TPA: ribonuclease P protein component [Tissierellia bacterium]|nr:ribonuclease P protein component [Tissierellia bacterium]
MDKLPVLKKNKEFQRVYNKGKFAASSLLVVYILPNNLSVTRLGITASRKAGKAVKRNRMRRLVRENVRILYSRLEKGFDVVIVARKTEKIINLDIVGRELRYLLHKLGLLTDRDDNA